MSTREPILELDEDAPRLIRALWKLTLRFPWLALVLGIPLWPIGTVVMIVYGIRTMVVQENGLFIGLDAMMGLGIMAAGLIWPPLLFIVARQHKQAAKPLQPQP